MLGRFRRLSIVVAACAAISLFAAEVHVVERAEYGGTIETLRDQTLYTGSNYVTQVAPKLGGYIFTHWSTSATEGFQGRDVFGRAFDAAPFTLYDNVTLTAHYEEDGLDSDNDGIADGHELYWYGNLAASALTDTDGDGMTFAEELAAGTNPLYPDRSLSGVVTGDSSEWTYNPSNYHAYVIRSEPEGELFATVTGYAKTGDAVTTPTMDRLGGFFACWKRDGARVADVLGRAMDAASFEMPDADVELVAVASFDDMERASLYWYGSTGVSPSSDTDGDGMTFEEEVKAGTNPLFPDRSLSGVVSGESAEWLYNPSNYHAYVFRSEPEGALFETVSGMAMPGVELATPMVDRRTCFFAHWTRNGERVADALGRAEDQVVFAMPAEDVELVAHEIENEIERAKMYWYGDASVGMDGDTDGDGMTFAQEIAAGTNPLFPDRSLSGVESDVSVGVEMNLQPYEQMQGAIVAGAYSQMFTSPVAGNAATSATFGNGGAVWPVVADLNGDGLWDLIVVGETTTNVFLNVGRKGNPEFVEDASGAFAERAMPFAETNSVAKLEGLSLDVPASDDALSATSGDANQDGVADLLVSDGEGRIWFYAGDPQPADSEPQALTYTLQHKVWGGSYAGFAQGLRLAAVDWEDDGDLDCLAGTADGKLMLLRDPRVGRPTSLKALAGVDNVLLTWDPNAQSRIRGYKVYRKETEGIQGTTTDNSLDGFVALIPGVPFVSSSFTTALPTYRDFPGGGQGLSNLPECFYKVSSVSRFYTAGNSTPTETESMPSEAVRAELGKVKFFWNSVAVNLGEQAAVMLSIENSMNYDVTGKTQTIIYDPAYLAPVKVVKSGLTEGCDVQCSVVREGEWQISIIGAVGGGTSTLPAGSGKFLTLVFDTVKEGTTKVGGDSGATVLIAAASEPVPHRLGDLDGDGDVDKDDLQLLAMLKSGVGQHPTAYQLMAGDFNGNGKLDNADFQALKELLKDGGQ